MDGRTIWEVCAVGRAKRRLSRDFEITLPPRMRLGRSLALPLRQTQESGYIKSPTA